MGYSTRTVKAPTETDHGFYIVRAGFPIDGKEVKTAYFGPVRKHLEERAEKWLQDNNPNTINIEDPENSNVE